MSSRDTSEPLVKLKTEPQDQNVHETMGNKWEFNGQVAATFDDMLNRSIPQIDVMRQAVTDAAVHYAQRGSTILDLGCSRGEALWQVANAVPDWAAYNFVGVEVSEPMRRAAEARFAYDPDDANKPVAAILGDDLRAGMPRLDSSVIMSVLTLQFVPIEYRQAILERAYENLRPGGAFLLVEKVLGATAKISSFMVGTYHGLKSKNGYSGEEIERKALALEGVLVPVTAKWNEEFLQQAGFRQIDVFWRWMNFAGWIAVK